MSIFGFDFAPPANIVICGETGSGKTFKCKQILRLMNWDYLVIICPTLKLSGDYNEYVERENDPDNKVFKYSDINDFTSNFETMRKEQYDLIKNFPREQVPHIVVVIDDCANTSVLNFRGILDNFGIKSRHFNISMIILSQRIKAIPATLRINCKMFILFTICDLEEMEKFVNSYVQRHNKKKMLQMLPSIYNKKYNHIVANNQEEDITKRLYKNGTELIRFNDT